MLAIMDQPWFRKLFGRPQKPAPENPRTQADDENAETQFKLGLKFARGEQSAPDFAQAARCYLKAANQNHALAQFTLGNMFADGRGVPRNEAEARMWILRAAQQGHAPAQYNLGLRCHRASADGLPQDARERALEAYKWFRLAAAQGYRGSGAAYEGIALGMTHEQVLEGNQRVTAFIATHPSPVPAQS
jgi:TPR repeat protein